MDQDQIELLSPPAVSYLYNAEQFQHLQNRIISST